MSVRINRNLHKEIAKFGGTDIDLCMNCGNCTAVCPLSKDSTVFPRKLIRYLQLGVKEKVLASPEPWLCYYCGECSDTCPRDANPGETMMATRRYLISQYDWTGISRLMYTSKWWEFGMISLVALIVLALFAFLHGPMVTDRVELNTFAPAKWVELGDWIMAAVLSFFLLTNAFRLYRYIMKGDRTVKVPLSLYIREFKTLIIHTLTQKQWLQCDNFIRWLKHFLLVTGYATMFILIVVFLRWFQTDEIRSFWHPSRLLGYYATFVLLYITVDMMIGRLRKKEAIHKFSHLSDWMFLVLLFLTSLTGILVHIFRLSGLPLPTYYIYVIHLMVAVPMLVVEVPFSKWSHLLFRPLVIFLVRVLERARALPAPETPAEKQEAA